jgi:hypothetical protein
MKYLGTTLDAKLRLGRPMQERMRRAWTKIQENVLAHGKKVGSVDTQ